MLALASGLFGFSTPSHAQDGDPQPIVSRALAATVDYGNDAVFYPAKHITDFEQLGIRAETVVTITAQFPTELAGQQMLVEPLDGGVATIPEEGLIVDSEGKVTFQFQTSDFFGACRIALHQPDDSNFVQFWIVDPNHPENTPPNLAGVY